MHARAHPFWLQRELSLSTRIFLKVFWTHANCSSQFKFLMYFFLILYSIYYMYYVFYCFIIIVWGLDPEGPPPLTSGYHARPWGFKKCPINKYFPCSENATLKGSSPHLQALQISMKFLLHISLLWLLTSEEYLESFRS